MSIERNDNLIGRVTMEVLTTPRNGAGGGGLCPGGPDQVTDRLPTPSNEPQDHDGVQMTMIRQDTLDALADIAAFAVIAFEYPNVFVELTAKARRDFIKLLPAACIPQEHIDELTKFADAMDETSARVTETMKVWQMGGEISGD